MDFKIGEYVKILEDRIKIDSKYNNVHRKFLEENKFIIVNKCSFKEYRDDVVKDDSLIEKTATWDYSDVYCIKNRSNGLIEYYHKDFLILDIRQLRDIKIKKLLNEK